MYLRYFIKLSDKVKSIFFVIALTFINLQANAQPGDPTQDDCNIPSNGGPDEPCPLDTWVYVLVIVALLVGAYRLHTKKKQFSLNEK